MNEVNAMMQGMISDYSKYVDINSDEIVNDFCDKIREQKIGDLDLNTYSCFRFWKHVVHDSLKDFYKDFKKETRDKEITFEEFCDFTWNEMGSMMDEMPQDIASLLNAMKVGVKIEGAEA